MIGFDKYSYFQYDIFLAQLNEAASQSGHNSYLASLFAQITEFYNQSVLSKWNLPEGKRVDSVKFWQPIHETLQNSRVHGSKNSQFYVIGLWMGGKGFCFGCYNDGGFFKSPQIKHPFENGILLAKSQMNLDNPNNHHCGINTFVFKEAEIIEVDDQLGVIYLANTLEKVLTYDKSQQRHL